jgi:hypothetical protein
VTEAEKIDREIDSVVAKLEVTGQILEGASLQAIYDGLTRKVAELRGRADVLMAEAAKERAAKASP